MESQIYAEEHIPKYVTRHGQLENASGKKNAWMDTIWERSQASQNGCPRPRGRASRQIAAKMTVKAKQGPTGQNNGKKVPKRLAENPVKPNDITRKEQEPAKEITIQRNNANTVTSGLEA